ncbi:hypothetical protein [Krasilnikovia sp. MM14-A1259]|uniref:hypothetical protein n=1 Tax=Krasilnikovia sp. MM14-A1259 TaxID=3373539 RepID=UPI0038184603
MYFTIARHIAGAAAAWLVFCVEGAAGYAGLLVFAGVTGADPGGPLAGPFLMLVAAVVGGAVTSLALLPSVVIGEVIGRLQWLVALGVVAVLLGVAAAGWSAATDTTAREAAIGWSVTVAASLLPLAAWGAVAAVGSRIRNRLA